MIKKKVCMVGAFAVGKTSLVRQFVYSIFSSKYHTTVGVKIDKKQMACNGNTIDLILWDLHGEDEFQNVRMSYLKGASGCIYVVDGTRLETLETALRLKDTVEETLGAIPSIIALNKLDLLDDWEIDKSIIERLQKKDNIIIQTSAKTGRDVEAAFRFLTRKMLEG